MGDLSEHFDREEFKCNCGECNQDAVDHELIVVLERLRTHFGSAVIISSGNRCPAYNAHIGGAKDSQHLSSKAADIHMYPIEPEDVYSMLCGWYPDKYGIGLYSAWVHIDVRQDKGRW